METIYELQVSAGNSGVMCGGSVSVLYIKKRLGCTGVCIVQVDNTPYCCNG